MNDLDIEHPLVNFACQLDLLADFGEALEAQLWIFIGLIEKGQRTGIDVGQLFHGIKARLDALIDPCSGDRSRLLTPQLAQALVYRLAADAKGLGSLGLAPTFFVN